MRKVLVEEGFAIAASSTSAMTLDRGRGTPVVMASPAGGMEIEEVAAHAPEKILRELVDPARRAARPSRRASSRSASASRATSSRRASR